MANKEKERKTVSSFEAAKKIADVFEVSLDYLVGKGEIVYWTKNLNLKRIEDLKLLEGEKKLF